MDAKFIAGSPLPESVGQCADMFKEVSTLRLAMQKQVDAVKARESEIKTHLINSISKSDDTGASGEFYQARIKQSEVPTADNWDEIRKFVVAYDRWDIFEKRLSAKAIQEIWEAGVEIPGVGTFTKTDVSITKIK